MVKETLREERQKSIYIIYIKIQHKNVGTAALSTKIFLREFPILCIYIVCVSNGTNISHAYVTKILVLRQKLSANFLREIKITFKRSCGHDMHQIFAKRIFFMIVDFVYTRGTYKIIFRK